MAGTRKPVYKSLTATGKAAVILAAAAAGVVMGLLLAWGWG